MLLLQSDWLLNLVHLLGARNNHFSFATDRIPQAAFALHLHAKLLASAGAVLQHADPILFASD